MTRLRDKIPVEQLDVARLNRIEREVLTAYRERAIDPRPRRIAVLARWLVPAVAIAGVAFAVYLNLRRTAAPPPARAVAGSPTVTAVDTTASEGTRLEIGDAVVIAGAATRLEIERGDHGAISIALASGTVDCEVAPRGNRPPFVVQAGEVAVTVVGTAFQVERAASQPDDPVRVRVRHGRVRVDAIGGSHSVAAGEDWSGPATRLAAAAPNPVTPPPDDPVAMAPIDPPEVELRPHHVARPVPAPTPAIAPAPVPTVKEERATVLAARPVRARPTTAESGELAAIMSLESKEPEAAVKQYQQLAATDRGDTARFALYSMAYVQYFQLGQRRAAIDTAKAFERRFPRGGYAEDVLWLRIRATCEVAVDKECRAAAHTYLDSFPGGAYTQSARQIVNWM